MTNTDTFYRRCVFKKWKNTQLCTYTFIYGSEIVIQQLLGMSSKKIPDHCTLLV